MSNKYKNVDAILMFMSKNIDIIPKRPETISKGAGLEIDRSESYMILNMLLNDGYVYEGKTKGKYGILYKGILFIENGGYELKHKISLRKKRVMFISDMLNTYVKPIIILSALISILLNVLEKIVDYYNLC